MLNHRHIFLVHEEMLFFVFTRVVICLGIGETNLCCHEVDKNLFGEERETRISIDDKYFVGSLGLAVSIESTEYGNTREEGEDKGKDLHLEYISYLVDNENEKHHGGDL